MKTIEIIYNNILKKVEQFFGHNLTTYDYQLDEYCKMIFGDKWKGVYPIDKIPSPLKDGYYIINLDKSYETGSHWCSICKKGDKIVLYDSFGRTKQLSKIPELIKLKIIFTESDAEQTEIESNCGQRCTAFLVCCHLYGIEEAIKI